MGAGRLIPALALCGLATWSEPEPWRTGACRHVHRAAGVTASLLVAEHPRGVVAMVEICNATPAAIHVSPRSLPGAPFLLWDGEAVPTYLGSAPGGEGPSLAPGKKLAFDVDLGELYDLLDGMFYQCAYAVETSAGTSRSDYAGFYLRLTD